MVIVMLTPLAENGIKQCHQYWPDEGSDLYHLYEVKLLRKYIVFLLLYIISGFNTLI